MTGSADATVERLTSNSTFKLCSRHFVTRRNDKVSCNVYERRPSACREFKPGEPACRFARRQAGLA
jgi:Fe-S-cluster containining protein